LFQTSQLKILFLFFACIGQELFTWRLLVTICILIAVTAELISLSTKTARKLGDARARRPKDRRMGEGVDELDMPEVPKTALSRERLLAERGLYRKEIRAERSRGVAWLAFCTLVAIWCTGILFKENALQP
jgi:hypothetical protein